MTALIASTILTLALAAYIFYPEKKVAAQRQKTRYEYLTERKAQLYENLRDLNFEHRSGKYRDKDYNAERTALEAEAAAVLTEMETIETTRQKRRT